MASWKIQELFTGTGHKRIRKMMKTHKRQAQSEEELSSLVTKDIRHRLAEDHMSPLFSVCDLLDYVKQKSDKHPERCKCILLETVDIMATYRIPSRTLVRAVLKRLVRFTGHIHREVILFEFSKLPVQFVPIGKEELRRKYDYILCNVAGWKDSWGHSRVEGDDEEEKEPSFYLELPLQRGCTGYNSLIVEALYRLKSASLVLSLLQNGVYPAAVFLWPVTLLADVKLSTHKTLEPESFEVLILRYFCRARTNFIIHLVDDGPKNVGFDIKGSDYDNILLISNNVLHLIPEDRFLSPASLKQQCRIVIRDILLQRDRFPHGLESLIMPSSMKLYLNLLVD